MAAGEANPVRLKAKVVLVGADHRIKTTLVRPSVSGSVPDAYIDLLGAKVSKKIVSVPFPRFEDPVRLHLMVWDISAARALPRGLLDDLLLGARGIFAVCDAADPGSVRDAEAWIEGVFRRIGKRPVVLVAALPEGASGAALSEDDLQAVAERYGASCLFSSARSPEATDRAFRILGERITGLALEGPRAPPPDHGRGPPASPR